MTEPREYDFFLKELFPGAGPELARLLQGAAENTGLLRSDFYAICDWLDLAGQRDDAVLPALLLLMQVALEEGSLCLDASAPALMPRLRDFVPEAEAGAWAERIEQAVASRRFAALVGTSPADPRPVILVERGAERFLYFQRYLQAEVDFQRELSARLQTAAPATSPDWQSVMAEVRASAAFPLDDEQRRAVEAALANRFTIISGGPGTGKTTIVLTLLRSLIRAGIAPERIALAAPTGRAAQRLSDSLRAGLDRLPAAADAASPDAPLRGLAATTLHQMLGYRPTRHIFTRHRENPIPADVVIVDEASMVGLVLMSSLLQAADPACKLILLGDKDQLPSVEAGAVLASLVVDHAPTLRERIVLLETNHRSQAEIRAAAQAINAQDAGIVERLPAADLSAAAWPRLEATGGCWLLEQTLATPHELHGFAHAWIEQAYFSAFEPEAQARDAKSLACASGSNSSLAALIDAVAWTDSDPLDAEVQDRLRGLFRLLDRYRLLTLVRDGAWGCNEINRYCDWLLRPRLDPGARGDLFAGAPVLITRNDAARGLYNGDIGLTLRQRGGGLTVLFPRQDQFVAVPAAALPAHELGFALTVHKSQGSEYANVMVILPPAGGKRLLTKELLYTAITRAKSLAVVCSSKDVLQFAIRRRIVRESGLAR